MLIITKNSTYKVTPRGNHFMVVKIAETQPNPNEIGIGWTRFCTQLSVAIGKHARFDSVITTEVQKVEE